ncbi:MAG: mechanosensitive ion channel domain-containing protein [bacterium]
MNNKRIILILLLLGIFLSPMKAVETQDSPYKTILVFEKFADVKNFDTLVGKFNFPSDMSKSKKVDYIEKFKKVLDTRVLRFNMTKVPTSPDFVDSATLEKRYHPFKEQEWIYLEKVGNKWLFSSETVKQIDPQYKKEFFADLSKFEKLLPTVLVKTFLTIAIWKWISLAAIILIGLLLFRLLIVILHGVFVKLFKRFSHDENFNHFIPPLSKPFSLLIVLFLASQGIKVLMLPDILAMIFNYGFTFLIPFMGLILLYRLCDVGGAFLISVMHHSGTNIDTQIVSLLVKIAKVVAIIFGLMYIINAFGWNIMPLLAGASIGGLAFALAAADTVKNLFASVTLYNDKTFSIGDWIKFDSIEGVVEEIHIRTTRIRTFNNSLLTVPNNVLVNTPIDNMGKRQLRKYSTKFALPFGTPTEVIDAFVEELRQIILNHPNTAKDNYQVHFSDINSYAYEIMFVIHINAQDYTEEMNTRNEILREVLNLAKILNLKFAFNTQTVRIIND